MDISFDQQAGGTLVRVTGRMDAVTAPDFQSQCLQAIEGGATNMVVDLSGLEYISSAGLRSILASAKKIMSTGGAMKFCGLNGMVGEVFKVSGLGSMFTIAATPEEAFKS